MTTTEKIEQDHSLKSVSFQDIIRHSENHAINDECYIHTGCATGHFNSTDLLTNFFADPIRVDALVFILCTKGTIEFTCNLREYQIEAGSLLMLPPKSLISEQSGSQEHEGYAVIFDQQYMSDCNFNVGRFISLMAQVREQLSVKISDEEQTRLLQGINLLNAMIGDKNETQFRNEMIRSMVETLTYQFINVFSLHCNKEENTSLTRQETYFRQFMQELNEHYMERQGVTFYAEKLCISSRYLTTIVRRVSGLTVTEWMNRYLLMEAKYLLKYSEYSIQEIAYRLSFPDQSFFGKYFKQHVGQSPSAYRSKGK